MDYNVIRNAFIVCFMLLSFTTKAQLFQEDFGTGFSGLDAVKWPAGCRSGTSGFNTSIGACYTAADYNYGTSGFGSYTTSQGIAIPATGYDLTFEYSYDNSFSFPDVEIRTGTGCGTVVAQTESLTNTSGVCTPHTISLNAYAGQTIYIRLVSNTSGTTTYWDDFLVDLSSGGGGGTTCLLDDDFGSSFASINTTNWPTACRSGSPSSFNTSAAPCASAGEYGYGMSGYMYITSMALAIPATGYSLDFDYSFNQSFSTPDIEILTGGPCGTSIVATHVLPNTSGVCTPHSINLDTYAGQTIYIRFNSNSSLQTFYMDEVKVCGSGGLSGDYKWADNFNDNDLDLDYPGNDGDEACTGCGQWTLGGGAAFALVPAGGWQGNSNETEAFPDAMPNVYYAKLDRNEYIESPTLDMSALESFKISFYAKSSSPGTGGGDNWSFSDRLKLQIWDGSAWITVESMRDDLSASWSNNADYISSALPFNYYCFTAYKSNTSPGNYYYNSAPNVNNSYFHSDFKFRVIFEGGFSGSPFAWVDDFTFRADADGYSTMIPCGISFWNQPGATSYGQDPGTTGNNNAEKGVELELDNSINIPPLWASEADDGDTVTQVFGSGESERIVFAVLSEQEINFAFPKVHFYAPSMGWQSSVMSIDNSYSGPGWRYYAVEYISCDLAGGSIAEPTDDFQYYYSFEYGNEFIPVFYQLNTSGIEFGGGVTSLAEVFNAPDVISEDDCGAIALGVELLNFDAIPKERQVILNWSTANELNNDYFEIERSNNGVDFEQLGQNKGNGTSNQINSYQWIDNEPLHEISYYRLKQVDFDGSYSYSDIRSVNYDFGPSLFIYPNPSKDWININSILESDYHIVNSLGQDLTDKMIEVFSEKGLLRLKVADLESGLYFFIQGSSKVQFTIQ